MSPRSTSSESEPNENESKVLRAVHKDPFATHTQLAVATGLEEHRVRYAMEQMEKKNWIERAYRIDPAILGFPERYRVDIWITPRELKLGNGGLPGEKEKVSGQWALAKYIVENLSQQSPFKDSVMVEEVRILLGGPADLSATVRAKGNAAMLQFVTDGLRMCGAIEKTSTSLEMRSYPHGKI